MAASRNKLAVDLLSRVADFMAARLPSDQPLCVGLSGGCDSVVLLHLLSRLQFGERLSAVHIHHGLSSNADAWAEFCLDYSQQLALPCRVVRVEVDRESGSGLEAAARTVRYAAFAQAGIRHLLLAHHAGDQAETLLFNLFRGSGVAGLAAMPAELKRAEMHVLRPLLSTTRAEIEAYARQEGLAWISDESNTDTHFSRNFIRHEVLTVVSQRFPAVEKSLSLAATHCAEADALLAELAEEDWRALSDGESIVMRRLQTLSLSRLKNLLRYRLRELAWRVPSTSRLKEFARQLLATAADRHPQLDLPDGSLRVQGGKLHWLAQNSQSVTCQSSR
jgi:tRNA(Ile)-lysidine synthase